MATDPDETKSVMDDDDARVVRVGHPRLVFVLCADALPAPSQEIALTKSVLIGRSSDGFAVRVDGDETVVEIPDGRISARHARVTGRLDRWSLEDLESKNGTLKNGHRVNGTTPIRDGDVLELGHSQFIFRAATVSRPSSTEPPWTVPGAPLTTHHGPLASRFEALAKVATTLVPVMIRGESGVGKEVAAQAVHALSRRSGPFVPVNCGALPEGLVESELFGVERGAFSGADRARPGLIRAAHEGTLFLDEIGELPLAAQVKLLRALQERAVTPVGGTKPVAVDFRLVTATHRRLEEKVAKDAFRGDLLARIEGFTLEIPPLRERREDIGLLLRAFAAEEIDEVTLSRTAARALMLHAWPFNVRQLEKVVTLGLALRDGPMLTLEHLESIAEHETPASAVEAPVVVLPDNDEERRARLVALLIEHEGNISRVAAVTGKARMQIHRWLKRYGIDRHRPDVNDNPVTGAAAARPPTAEMTGAMARPVEWLDLRLAAAFGKHR